MMINDIPAEVKGRLNDLIKLRDTGCQEQNFRRRSHGRRFNPDLRDMPDLELNQAVIWYERKIDELLAPYERR